MAFTPKSSLFLACFVLCFPLQINSLSSVSISYTFNQTVVCALVPSSNKQSFLHCSSFPSGLTRIPIKSEYVSYDRIVGGNGFLCALRSYSLLSTTSVIECWRFSANGTKMSHKRVYRGPILSDLAASDSQVCGLVSGNNTLECWQWRPKGSNPDHVSHPGFSSIAVGDDFVCGLDEHGHILCLGDYARSVTGNEPRGRYSVISAGSHHACAISLNGSLACWGNMVGKKPKGEFIDLALGESRSCAIRVNGTVICWGIDDFSMPRRLQETNFIGIIGKKGVFCGVVASNYSLLCWGNEIPDGNFSVFSYVMPGSCKTHCPSCGALPGYGYICQKGLMVCQPCSNRRMDEGVSPTIHSPFSSPKLAPSLNPSSGNTSWSAKMVAFLVLGCLGFISLVSSTVFLLLRCHRHNGRQVHVLGPVDTRNTGHQTRAPKVLKKRLSHMYSIDEGGNLEEFPLEMLLQVTNNFSEEHIMGRGSFGSVYHATLPDGREVAIKRAEFHPSPAKRTTNKHQKQSKDSAFLAELEVLSRLNHKHLVKLHGFYEDSNERVLIYEFMSNGTLHDHLHKLKSTSLLSSWPTRLKVALDSARGIEYLHEYAEPTIIHRDIKPSNILLDHDWTAKVSDFGLSLRGPQEGESHLSLQPIGTFGYVDPEYYKFEQLTTKSDVYSFGVVLLEILSGYTAVHASEDGTPRNIVDFVAPYVTRGDIHKVLDPSVPPPTPVEIEAVEFIGDLAVECVSQEGRYRPAMSEVASHLERALATCLAPPVMSSSSTGSLRFDHVPI